MRGKTWIGIVIFLLLALATRWIQYTHDTQDGEDSFQIDTRLDYALTELDSRTYDEQGRLAAMLQSPMLVQDADTGVGRASRPLIRLPGADGETRLLAEAADINAEKTEIQLAGAVEIRLPQPEGEVQISGEEIAFHIPSEVIRSEQPIEITGPGIHLTGIGLEADLRTRRYRLMRQIRGRYENR